jgi:3-phenylpropionate/trans-cinnamate dioxygenase ferredoxin reductase subunit
VLPADIVVVGVGVRPAADWLAGSGIQVDDGVVCDAGCSTGVPNVVAVGDVARCPNPFTGRHARIEHWSNATEQAKTAARTLLTGVSALAPLNAPYFWSDQYQVRIQLAGHVTPGAQPEVVDGDIDSRTFTAVYRCEGAPVAVLSLNQPKYFNRLRRTLVPAAAAAAVS